MDFGGGGAVLVVEEDGYMNGSMGDWSAWIQWVMEMAKGGGTNDCVT